MAETLAENLLGGARLFEGADLSTRLKVLGLDVAVLGEYNQPAAAYSWESGGCYRRIVVRGGRLAGASALGEWPDAGEMQDAVRNGRHVWNWQIQRFRKHGFLWPPRRRSVRDWPAEATVCNCMNVSCGALMRARHDGCCTVEALAQATGASTLCGSCKPLLAELAGAAPVRETVQGTKSLRVAALAAFALTLILWAAPAIPYAPAVQASSYDILWRDGQIKQISGFTVAGLSLLGLLMSARKRLAWFRRGEFGRWRAVHGMLGVAGLLALAGHTGMRFGSNLNAALMTVFVLSNLAGALTGSVASSDRLAAVSYGPALRRGLVWAHIGLVWPLPVLLGFHIVAVYYF
jgi:nitrite reductase (NADH) large subunit